MGGTISGRCFIDGFFDVEFLILLSFTLEFDKISKMRHQSTLYHGSRSLESLMPILPRLGVFYLLVLIASLFFFNEPEATACMYFDKKIDPHSFKEKDREALLFHDGEAANLILKTSFSGKLPKRLAWVFPLPSKPIDYKTTSPGIFNALGSIFDPGLSKGLEMGGGGPASRGASHSRGIKVHEAKMVGDYEIIPIEILSESSGVELNDWLKKQGFNDSPTEIQKPYLKKGAFFLAIRTTLSGEEADLAPLWIRYPATKLSFPLRFTHTYRTYNSKVYFLTAPDKKIKPPTGRGWKSESSSSDRILLTQELRFEESPYEDDSGKQIKVSTGRDRFEDVMNYLIEFRNVPAVAKFLNGGQHKLTRISMIRVNSPKTPKMLQTKDLESDPEADI